MRRRNLVPLTISSNVLDEIGARASAAGCSADEIVDALLSEEIPKMLAEVVRHQLITEMRDIPRSDHQETCSSRALPRGSP
jgi:hypothetical protein